MRQRLRQVAFLRAALAMRPVIVALCLGLTSLAVSVMPADRALAGEESSLDIEVPVSISMSRIDVQALPAEVTPTSIEVGVPCGMQEMCGQDPCLCGSADQWGACACNGTQEVHPALSLMCDREGVVGMAEIFGTMYLVALGTGSTDAVVRAELPHGETAEATTHVEVEPFGFGDVFKLLVAGLAMAAVCAVIFLAIRAVARGIRRLARWASRRHIRGAFMDKASGEEDDPCSH